MIIKGENLNITTSKDIDNAVINVYSSTGKIILSKTFTKNNTILPIDTKYSFGMYYAQLLYNNKTVMKKFFIVK